jgi:hypothetical protein
MRRPAAGGRARSPCSSRTSRGRAPCSSVSATVRGLRSSTATRLFAGPSVDPRARIAEHAGGARCDVRGRGAGRCPGRVALVACPGVGVARHAWTRVLDAVDWSASLAVPGGRRSAGRRACAAPRSTARSHCWIACRSSPACRRATSATRQTRRFPGGSAPARRSSTRATAATSCAPAAGLIGGKLVHMAEYGAIRPRDRALRDGRPGGRPEHLNGGIQPINAHR